MKNSFKLFLAAVLGALLLSSCASSVDEPYYKLRYEVTSEPSVNMVIKYQHPGLSNLYQSGGSSFSQECGYVKKGFSASVCAEVIPVAGLEQEYTVRLKIYENNVCKAETTGVGSATLNYSVGSGE